MRCLFFFFFFSSGSFSRFSSPSVSFFFFFLSPEIPCTSSPFFFSLSLSLLCIVDVSSTFSPAAHASNNTVLPLPLFPTSPQASSPASGGKPVSRLLRKALKGKESKSPPGPSRPYVPPGGAGSPPPGGLYGRSLSELFVSDGSMPEPVAMMLSRLYVDGPEAAGIFRKSANARWVSCWVCVRGLCSVFVYMCVYVWGV